MMIISNLKTMQSTLLMPWTTFFKTLKFETTYTSIMARLITAFQCNKYTVITKNKHIIRFFKSVTTAPCTLDSYKLRAL